MEASEQPSGAQAAAAAPSAAEETDAAVSPLMAGLAEENAASGENGPAAVAPPAESPGSAKIKLPALPGGRRKVRIAPEPDAEEGGGGA